MTPQEFVHKWRPVALTERQAAQEPFGDLCRLLGELTPIEADPEGINYAFEKGANRATGGAGWADVWKRRCFAIEYKKRHANLGAALKQLLNYAGALANPPLLLTCDTDRIEIHTNWNDLVSTTTTIRLEELLDPEKLQLLENAFTNPDALRPVRKRAEVTAIAATRFAELAGRLRRHGHPPQQVAHFVNQILFRSGFTTFRRSSVLKIPSASAASPGPGGKPPPRLISTDGIWRPVWAGSRGVVQRQPVPR